MPVGAGVIMPMKQKPVSFKKYGWKKDRPDLRDYPFHRLAATLRFTAALPDHVYLRRFCSEVSDQGQLGSCTANALTNLLEYNECAAGRGGKQFKDLSRLFVYYNERVLENSVDQDAGAEIRDGVKTLASQGVCPEIEWPYLPDQFAVKPAAQCYTDAMTFQIHSYYRLTTLTDMRTSLANGCPFVFGFAVYDSFESQQVADTGIVPMPNVQNESFLGGHAVMAMGYNDAQQRFLVKNSWGKHWGLPKLPGYFTIPYAYLADNSMANDIWTILRV